MAAHGLESAVKASSDLDRRVVAGAIAVPAVVVQAKGHGHAGTAMALAGVAHALFGRVLRHDPADPAWAGRDRFILSAGHASLLLYLQLCLTGYGLTLGDVARTRLAGSRTPGHPERGHTPGVEMSTGPLGQGVASAAGLALAARRDEALFGAGTGLFDPTIWVLAGDGCLSEGVSGEACSLAGTLGLDNLVLIWDDNRITIDGPTSEAFAEDVRARYAAYGWRVIDVPDHLDVEAITAALREARRRTGQPTLVAVRSVIGWPSPAHQGRPSAHAGAYGEADVAALLTTLGFPSTPVVPDDPSGLGTLLPDDVVASCREAAARRGTVLHQEWDERLTLWQAEHPDLAAERNRLASTPVDLTALAAIDVATPQATRVTSGAVLRALDGGGRLWGGSADLAGSTATALPGPIVSAHHPAGGGLRFGIREHAMAAILNGIALHGLWRPYGSTYLVFSDYARGAIRLAALMKLPVTYVLTHDSVAVGEDGPTHQPVEQLASLRAVPDLDVVRPGDARETVAVWRHLLRAPVRPTAVVLSRQAVPVLPVAPDEAVWRGGYILWELTPTGTITPDETTPDGNTAGKVAPECRSTPRLSTANTLTSDLTILIATGSEVALAVEAARVLADAGYPVRVVSMPCPSWFDAQPRAYRDSVLPPAARRRIAVEAGRTDGWYKYVGLDGAVIGVDEFGQSAPGETLRAGFGLTTENVVRVAKAVIAGQPDGH
ncbi:MAG: transketolase [Propionibacteriaceae bacterium]|jgi:transketolase|nr:transketolase [Propionibacteriaceae bacterium]